MKRIILLFVILNIATLGFAQIAGSEHDMYFMGKGTDSNICSYCHISHNAAGSKIWSEWANETQLTSGPSTTIGNMCYTCHDGTTTNKGQNTVFNIALQQHEISSGEDCTMCHTVHDNTNGKFMNVARTQNYYCASCHSAIVDGGGFGDMTTIGNHQSYWTPGEYGHSSGAPPMGAGACAGCHTRIEQTIESYNSCDTCHNAHGAADYSTASATKPILSINNSDSALCATCHPIMVQDVAGGAKHPANLSGAGPWGKVVCQDCHDAHNPGSINPFILTEQNIDSQMCINCHDGVQGPDIGNSHPAPFVFGSITPTDATAATGTPAANQINDTGYYGVDYPLNSGNLVCESCHSVHRKADDPGTKLLRITNINSALCINCHTDK